jgi:hypothetical protein
MRNGRKGGLRAPSPPQRFEVDEMLQDAMIVWTPNRDMWEGSPTAGQIAVTTIPEAPALKAHPMSAGACDLNWRKGDGAERRKLLQQYFTQIVHRDKLDEETVRQALSVIADTNVNQLSAEAPDPDDES